MIKTRMVIDVTDIPEPYATYISESLREYDDYPSNGSYHNLDIEEYRSYCKEEGFKAYVEDCGNNKAMFMQWLEQQTSADTVLLLYWW